MKQYTIQLTQIINKKSNKMKKLTLLFAALLAVCMSFATTFVPQTGALTEGDYLITYGTYAMKNTVANDRLQYETITAGETVASSDASILWHIAFVEGDSICTIYNAAVQKYAAGTGVKNKAALYDNATDNGSTWVVTATEDGYEFVNIHNRTAGVNRTLRNNGTYGFACYSTQTGGALKLYKVTNDTTIVPPVVVIDTTEVTCAEASALALALPANNQDSEELYAVTGYITEVVGNVSRNQQTFWMADSIDGGQVFEGYWANLPANFDSFEVGMQVRMVGHLRKYNTTPEMKNGDVEILAMPVVPEPVHYYIKNNWNGAEDWAWVEMNPVMNNVIYEHTGVFGGRGVNINTAAEDNANAIWFPVENFSVLDSTFVPQALDTLHFVYSIVDSVLAVELVGRPEPAPARYFIKNNWNGGSAWTWEEMSPVENNVLYEYTGVFGGSGVNINTMASDDGYTWFPVADFRTIDSTYVPQALDTIHFVYSIVDSALAVELVGRPAPAPVQYYIKNNWNGAADWTWVEMNPVMDNVLYEYTGVFGGTGVNINTAAADAGSTWFSVENFSVLDSTFVPQALDTLHFVYSIVDSALAVELVGRPEPIIIDSVTTILNITDVTGWENLYVYAWGGAEIFGSWPGEIALEQIIISGNYEGQTEHLIFNNGAGTQLADFDIVLMDTVYNIVVRADGAYFPEDVPTTNTCAEVNAITEATNMTLGEVTVVFAKGSNIYVQDATATTLVYTNKYADLVPGDRVQGIAGQAKLYYGLPELAATTEFADLVVTAGQAPRIPDAKTAPTMADINKVMMFRNVTMLDSAFTTPNNKAMNINGIFNGDTVTFRNNWKDTYTFEQGKTYTMLGCVAVYNNAIQVYVTNIEEYVEVPVQYYIKNNWNGGSAWTWEEMSPVLDNVLYEYTGVFGGTGVNINTTTADEDAIWFPVEKFSLIDSTYVPQALDTIHFVYSILDSALAVELVGRPAGDSVLHYYIKNNWEAGSEWTWVEMDMVIDSSVYEYTGVFGGTGVNINTMATDAGAIWFPVEDFSLIDPTYVPQALDTIHFVYSIVDSALAVELVGRPVIEEIQYYIKNNWNGGEWTWEEMTPANDGNITWTYRGIFGGTGVNINNLPIDADAIWFPVDKWLFTTLGYEPEAGDDILFEFNSELLTLTATFMGKVGLETVTFQREGETMKLIHNGQLYIIRDGKMYNALGAQVR